MGYNKKTDELTQHQFVDFVVDADVYKTTVSKKFALRKPYETPDARKITSFMPGTIREVFVNPGQEVSQNSKLCILEAMKMKNVILSPLNGKIKAINVSTGQMVPKNFVLIELE